MRTPRGGEFGDQVADQALGQGLAAAQGPVVGERLARAGVGTMLEPGTSQPLGVLGALGVSNRPSLRGPIREIREIRGSQPPPTTASVAQPCSTPQHVRTRHLRRGPDAGRGGQDGPGAGAPPARQGDDGRGCGRDRQPHPRLRPGHPLDAPVPGVVDAAEDRARQGAARSRPARGLEGRPRGRRRPEGRRRSVARARSGRTGALATHQAPCRPPSAG